MHNKPKESSELYQLCLIEMNKEAIHQSWDVLRSRCTTSRDKSSESKTAL
jgi:hypothetical protein